MRIPDGTKWQKTVDIAVIGYGMAGAVAAITARDKGASVAIIEKQDLETHRTPSSMSGGLYISPKDATGTLKYFEALSHINEGGEWTDSACLRVLAERITRNTEWFQGLGGKVEFVARTAEHKQLPGADAIELWEYRGKGLSMMKFMYDQVKKRNIEVQYRTPAKRLLTDSAGRVIGLKAASPDGKETNIKVTKAVVLCAGGFEGDEEMKLQFLRVYPAWFTGGSCNTGDGIRMAQEVGADLWHMNCVSARLVTKVDDYADAFSLGFGGKNWNRRRLEGRREKASTSYIFVDKYGRRYMNEDLRGHAAFYELTAYDTHRLEYPRVPSYFIFDKRRMEAGAIVTTGLSGPHQIYHWSNDNMAEVAKGWIMSAGTVAGLAGKMGVEPAVLEETISRWNKQCATETDADYGRDGLEMVALDSPPYYAMKLLPGGPNTQGGPRRNSRAQVLTPFADPIPGLYAAGECGSVYGMLYPVAGGNLAECIAYGQIAGEKATD